MTAAANCEPKDRQPSAATRVDAACLIAVNVNPQTGFATDYLNHFNEAIMLLELLAEMPDCREDFFAWQPRNYGQHFAASNFKYRDIAIAAYADANPELRQKLDTLADTMNKILMATREVMRHDLSHGTASAVAGLAAGWIKPLVARAGAVINGTQGDAAPQAVVDALMAR
jgi:hypothetical protein